MYTVESSPVILALILETSKLACDLQSFGEEFPVAAKLCNFYDTTAALALIHTYIHIRHMHTQTGSNRSSKQVNSSLDLEDVWEIFFFLFILFGGVRRNVGRLCIYVIDEVNACITY